MSHDVFISYAQPDKAVADAIVAKLETIGVTCWIAHRDIDAGTEFQKQIVDAISHCQVVVVVLSPAADDSIYVSNEVSTALEARRRVIPFVIQDFEFSKSRFSLSLKNIHRLNATTLPLESHLENLARTITKPPQKDINGPPPHPLQERPGETLQATRANSLNRHALVLSLGLLLALIVAAVLFYRSRSVSPSPEVLDTARYTENRNSFIGALPWLNWILYEPTGYDPQLNTGASEATIREDLRVLRQHGFDGLITASSRGIFTHIPRIAHEEGFHLVIMGVWEINDQEEINNALNAAKYADAYCLGHRGLNKRYPITLLEKTTELMRSKTARPTTTSELVLDYEMEPRLSVVSDFLFPDVHTEWQRGKGPEEAWTETVALAQRAAKLAAQAEGKHVLLKMVSFPSGGGAGLSPKSQATFYRLAIEQASDRNDIPARVSFSFLVAFDPVWKTESQGWQLSEQFTGLFTKERIPKLAVTQVKWRKPR